ncbi:hypothetical protein OEA41_004936 [Lepraria neglecta]|uniref:Uncharacterized protein n=1 Tax=Lepraria neglecta TaxID=209136 RepID=A0AAD9Z2V4_9LECA|nr:hypothetical protein OEA41_004936 [Lepraria neglecta]
MPCVAGYPGTSTKEADPDPGVNVQGRCTPSGDFLQCDGNHRPHQELERLKAERNTTIHGYVPYGRQRASNTKRSNGKAVRFENGELTPYEQFEGDTERRMSELDGNLLKEISDEVDRELAELSEEENDGQTTCEYGHEREQGDKEEGDSSSVVKRSSEGIIVSQKDVVKSTTNSSRTSEPQSALPQEALEIKKRYGALKASAWKWAVKHFPKVPNSTKPSLNLPRLAETSPELVEFVNYISACTDNPWEYIFNEQRPKLVYGILGKMLEVMCLDMRCLAQQTNSCKY